MRDDYAGFTPLATDEDEYAGFTPDNNLSLEEADADLERLRLEQDRNDRKAQKEEAEKQEAMAALAEQERMADPNNWTHEQTKKYLKENPPQTPEEETEWATRLEAKKQQKDSVINQQKEMEKQQEEAVKQAEKAQEEEKKTLMGNAKEFAKEGVMKSLARSIQKVPAGFESIIQVGLDHMRGLAEDQLAEDGAVFGREGDISQRSPEQKARIKRNNKIVDNLTRAIDNSKRIQAEWIHKSETGMEARDPDTFRGSFMENPSWTRAVSLGVEATPMLGMAAATSFATKNPIAGAAVLGVLEASGEHQAARDAGKSLKEAGQIFAADAIMLTALEVVPMTGFMKGGKLPIRMFRGAIQEGGEEVLQGIWVNSVAKIGYDETRRLTEGLVEAALAGALSGGVIGTMSPGRGAEIDRLIEKARDAGVDVDKMMEAAGEQVKNNQGRMTKIVKGINEKMQSEEGSVQIGPDEEGKGKEKKGKDKIENDDEGEPIIPPEKLGPPTPDFVKEAVPEREGRHIKTPKTSEDFEIRPERMKGLKKEIAVFDSETGKIHSYKYGEKEVFNHSDVIEKDKMDYDNIVPGFINEDDGSFVYQYLKDKDKKKGYDKAEMPDAQVFHKEIAAELGKENKGRTLSEDEKKAQSFVLANPIKMTKNYWKRLQAEYKTKVQNIVSADAAKFAINDGKGLKMTVDKSNEFHEAGSSFAKSYFKHLLSDPRTKSHHVFFSAGISGAGKTYGLRQFYGNEYRDFAAIYDTNVNALGSFEKKLKAVQEANKEVGGTRQVRVLYVHRDPVEAWVEGVMVRAVKQGRSMTIKTHVNNSHALRTAKEIAKKDYSDFGFTVRVEAIENKHNDLSHADIDSIKESGYTDSELEAILIKKTKELYDDGKISKKIYDEALEGSAKPGGERGSSPGQGKEGVPGQGQETGRDAGKRRKFITTVKEADKTAAELRQIIESRYQPISNKETLAAANQIIETDIDQAQELVFADEPTSALSNAIALRLIDKAQAEQNWEEAKRVVEKTAERNTKMGQAIQALSMYAKLSPAGMLKYAEKVLRQARNNVVQKQRLSNFEKMKATLDNDAEVEKLAKKLGIPYLSESLIKEIRERMEEIAGMPEGRDKAIKTALVLKTINSQIPVGLGKKIAFVQTLAQLLNPKTIIRNILGNAIFQGVEFMSDHVGVPLDILAGKFTGKRTAALPSVKTQAKGFISEGKASAEEVGLGINLRRQPTKFDIPQNGVFHGKVMGALEKLLAYALRTPDRAAYGSAFQDTLRKEMLLHEKNTGEKLVEPTAEMIERANLMGLYRTYQDDNALSRAFVGIKKMLNAGKDFGMGDMLLKYPRTPSNLLARGLEYSPLGFAKTILELAKPLSGHEFNQRKFVGDTQRALTGSVLLAGTGLILAELGIITGKREKDWDVVSNLREVGVRDYQVNVSALKRLAHSGMDPEMAKRQPNDVLVSYDWAQPLSISLAIGANLAIDRERSVADRAINMVERVAKASETLTEQPLMQGIRRITKKENILEGIANEIKFMPASFVPTLLNQVKQLTDNTWRNAKDPNFAKEAYNRAIYKMPGLSKTLPARMSTRGKPLPMYQVGSHNPFNVFLNPAFVNRYKPDETTQMVLDIWENTGERIHFPRVASGKVKLAGQKDRLILTPDEYHDYQAYIGRKTDILYGILQKNKKFMSMPDEEKAKKLQRALTDINSAAKIELFGNRPKHGPSKSVIDIIKGIHIDMQGIEKIEERRKQMK